MSFGDHWDEPARCGRCGQERSTHDDGECQGVMRSMSQAAKLVPPAPIGQDEIADRLYTLSVKCRAPLTATDWEWVAQSLQGVQEMIALEIWKINSRRDAP